MQCNFEQQGDECVCTNPKCRRRMKKSQHTCDKHHASCRSKGRSADYPSLAQQGVNFATALVKWVKKGRPVREAEEINRLLVICQGCEHYDAEREACTQCGCKAGNSTNWRNKLAWATEHCPIEKW